MNEEEMKQYLPCPFCGVNYNLVMAETAVFWVRCESENCGAEGPNRKTKKQAIKAWNTREFTQ